MNSTVIKRSIKLDGRKTSISLEDAFWRGLKDIASSQSVTISNLVGAINAKRQQRNLSSAIRIFVLEHHRNKDRSVVPIPLHSGAVSSDESRTPTWRGFARRG
jgi:predicted DNA-binding ribbon-helix-helix protein